MLSYPIIYLVLFTRLLLASCHRGSLKTIYQFPNGTRVENIAIRSNGKLLVTLVNTPEVWEVDPFRRSARLIYHFPEASMCNGITELSDDDFVVIASNVIHRLRFDARNDTATVAEVVNITQAGVLNGMATLDADAGTVVIADSRLGLVWRLDITTQTYGIVLQDPTMAARTGRRSLIGINGIKVLDDYVYYNNCPGRLFCRVQVDHLTGRAIGGFEVLAQGPLVLADDFAITSDGIAYLAGLDNNIVAEVQRDGTVVVVAGSLNSSALIGATAAAFGRTRQDHDVLYVTTGGGEAALLNGTCTESGKTVALHML